MCFNICITVRTGAGPVGFPSSRHDTDVNVALRQESASLETPDLAQKFM